MQLPGAVHIDVEELRSTCWIPRVKWQSKYHF